MTSLPEKDQPPAQYVGDIEPAQPGWTWSVVHARPRAEKKLADLCLVRGHRVFLPVARKIHFYGARRRVYWLPLFSGYVFVCLPMEDVLWLFRQTSTARVLEVTDQAGLVQQLAAVRAALFASDDLEVLPYLAEGRAVDILGGPLKGMRGVVSRIKGKDRVVINVDMIGTSVALEIDSLFLKAV